MATQELDRLDTQDSRSVPARTDLTSRSDVRGLLDQSIANHQVARLGEVSLKTDIKSTEGPFRVLSEYVTHYPRVITQGLADLYAEYNRAFHPLVRTNREWNTDYQHAMAGPSRTPSNFFVQIDMVGLPQEFLDSAENLDQDAVRETLRGRIFEIENSLAMYQLLMRIFSRDGEPSHFEPRFREGLNTIRRMHGKPIALLAVTDQKYQAMKESEFGKGVDEPLTDAEVLELSGFDRFFGPQEFQAYVEQNGGNCEYLLFARTSDPVAKLRKPNTVVENPLLERPEMRRIIKANAITFNVDDPSWPVGDKRRINDTKEYLQMMMMGYQFSGLTEVFTPELSAYLAKGKPLAEYPGDMLSAEFAAYLQSEGVDAAQIVSKQAMVRAKPVQASYGGYGHHRAAIGSTKLWADVREGLKKRGPYVIQPELQLPIITNEKDGQAYMYIDRNFFATDGSVMMFLGGFRSLMPVITQEADRGRVHGNEATVWAEIK